MNLLVPSLFLFFWGIARGFGANILYVASVPSPSHHIWNRALALGLANRGHNITYISPDENKNDKQENYNQILLEEIYDKFYEKVNINEVATYGPLQTIYAFQDWSIMICKLIMKTKGFQKLLNYPPEFKFDVIIFDITLGTCFYPLINKFNYPPSIAVTAFLLPQYVSHSFGNILYPAFIPSYCLPYTTEMNFIERLWNFLFTYGDIFIRYRNLDIKEHELAKEFFGDRIPSMKELERHVSLVLANTDPLLDYPQPLPPNIIAVGGLHTRQSKPVSEDIHQLLDKAKNGIIVFSLGTNIRSDKLGSEIQSELLNAFSKINETVIWKFESDIQTLPKNVFVRKWLPQNDILGHSNVKLFIGHGGALSTQEAIFHGVPMIVIPFIADQFINARMIVKKKLGVSIEIDKITSEYILQKLREVLNNALYTENMKKLSTSFKDRQETPLERGIFWTEYVLRHGGADFLNLPSRDLPLYKTMGVDIIAFLFVFMIIIIMILFAILILILTLFSGTKKVKIH